MILNYQILIVLLINFIEYRMEHLISIMNLMLIKQIIYLKVSLLTFEEQVV